MFNKHTPPLTSSENQTDAYQSYPTYTPFQQATPPVQPPPETPLLHGQPSTYLQGLLREDEKLIYYRKVRPFFSLFVKHEICGTNRRLIYLKKKLGFREFHEVPYKKIAGTSYVVKFHWRRVLLGLLLIYFLFPLFMGLIGLKGLEDLLLFIETCCLIFFFLLFIGGIFLILFSRQATLVIKMSGENILIALPRRTIASIEKEVSRLIDSMRRE